MALQTLALDVQFAASVDAAVATIIAGDGRIDVLVNNAGAGFARSIEQAALADIERIMDVNFMGVVRGTKAVLPPMRVARSGHVINISSVEPGGIQSEFARTTMQQMAASGGLLEDEYLPLLQKYLATARACGMTAYQTSDAVAAVVMQCIELTQPPIRIRTSAWAEDLCRLMTGADPDGKAMQQKVIEMFLGH